MQIALLLLMLLGLLCIALLNTDYFPGDKSGMLLFFAAAVGISLFMLVALTTLPPPHFPLRN